MPVSPRAVRLHESNIPSGNAYKVRLLLSHLGEQVEIEVLDILARPSETRRPGFLAKNPNGRIPVVELEDGSFLAESNAILCHLAEDTPYLPPPGLARARALSWMFFEQYSHEPYIAVLKYWTYWGGLDACRPEDIALWKSRGQAALEVMEQHLARAPFFTGDAYGVADIALFAYTHSAADVGYDVDALPALGQWLERVRAQPGYRPMKPDPLGRAPASR